MSQRRFFVQQLATKLAEAGQIAQRGGQAAHEAAKSMATAAEQKEDARVALEFGGLACGLSARARDARADAATLAQFYSAGLSSFGRRTPIGLGAVVDIEMTRDEASEERTFILLPVGAGTELLGPGGDGFLTVVTPASPVGQQLMGRRAGEDFDLTLRGEPHLWRILDVS